MGMLLNGFGKGKASAPPHWSVLELQRLFALESKWKALMEVANCLVLWTR